MLFKKKNKMNLKNTKKKIKKKYIVYLLIIYSVFSYTFYYSMKNNPKVTNEEFINFLVNGGNVRVFEDYTLPKVINNTVNFFLDIDFTKPDTLLNSSILSQGQIEETIEVHHNDDYSDYEELKDISAYIEDPNPVDIESPIIYIYNTHQLENYNNENLDIYGITPNVLMASYILKEKLNKMGIPSIVEDTNMTEFLNINGWGSESSYKASRLLILDKKSKYPSLKYFIDIHRDSIPKESSTANIEGKKYAKILFVVGLEHDNYDENLKTSQNLNNLFNEHYPGLSRGIYKKEGPGVDGIYNQDISNNSILIEVGGYQNNIEEVFNTIEAISNVLYRYVKDDSNE